MEPEQAGSSGTEAEITLAEFERTPTSLNDNVLAVFVVQFDVHKGNVIEWQHPQDFNLEGVEYQAICSGLHRIESDVIYFSREGYYGLSVFQNVPTDIERGAHMKAIGIIVQPTESTGLCGQIWSHQDYLEKELNRHMVVTDNIEPSRYESLLNYYTQHQFQAHQQQKGHIHEHLNTPESNYNSVNYNLKHNVTKGIFKGEDFGEDSFSDFVNKFGPDIFVLWKASLLRKRIMLVNMPPMEASCKYVYNIHLLGKVPAQFNSKGDIIPKFTVGVNDIPELEKKNQSYVTCTPDSIFQIKSDLYDLLITLPTPSFHHPIKGKSKNSPRHQQQQNIALSDLSNSQPDFKSNTVSTKHNTADFTRFRIMWKQLLSSSSTSWAEFVASEPNDLFGTTTALVTGIYYWLYEETSETSSSTTSRFFASWQDMFAGTSRRRSSITNTPLFLNQSSGTESQNLLLDEDEEDAMEINNNQVLEVVAARASTEVNTNHVNEDVAIKEDNEFLLGFFHTLTYYLLSTLQTILSINEEDSCPIINLYPKDIVQLGLDPQADVQFITEVALLYFKKRIQVNGIHNPQACISLCCQRKRHGAVHI